MSGKRILQILAKNNIRRVEQMSLELKEYIGYEPKEDKKKKKTKKSKKKEQEENNGKKE